MTTRTLWQRVRRIWVTLGLLVTVAFVGWSLIAYSATSEAKEKARGDARVEVVEVNGIVAFSATAQKQAMPVGLVFFPGSGVDPRAYAPLAYAVAEAGYPVILVPLPRRGMFGGADAPELITTAMNAVHDDQRAYRWIIGGHSRGAVIATKIVADLAALGANSAAGLLLIGTSHPRDVDLSKLRRPVTKIVGTNDGIATPERVEANKHLLPASTNWVRIEGGNHSQFGWYGFQPGDHFADISRDAQHKQMIDAVIAMIRSVSEQENLDGLPRR